MILRADKQLRGAWALENAETGDIPASSICTDRAAAEALMDGQHTHLAHQGKFRVIPVFITVQKA